MKFLRFAIPVTLLLLSGLAQAQLRLEPWSENVFKQIEKEHGAAAAKRMRNIYQFILDNQDRPLAEKLQLVNNKFNTLPWVADRDKWSAEDYWATPFETITQFGGDCEDMAIGKFMALRLMGVPKKNLHLGYVKIKADSGGPAAGQTHMVLVWVNDDRSDSRVLDNLQSQVKSGKQRTDLLAVYLADADGNLILLNDDGKQRSVKVEISNQKMQKLRTLKQRMRENQERYKVYNEGRPLLSE
jgi:predicted transglutaminase-like cysteine proteinase